MKEHIIFRKENKEEKAQESLRKTNKKRQGKTLQPAKTEKGNEKGRPGEEPQRKE